MPGTSVPPAVLTPQGEPLPFRLHRQPAAPGSADVVHHTWVVEWDLPGGQVHEQSVLTFPAHHVTVESDGRWVHGVMTRRLARRLTGRGRAIGAHLEVTGLGTLACDLDASAYTDRRVPLTELLPRSPGSRCSQRGSRSRRGRCNGTAPASSASGPSGSFSAPASTTRSTWSGRRAARSTGRRSPVASASPTRRTSRVRSPPWSACPPRRTAPPRTAGGRLAPGHHPLTRRLTPVGFPGIPVEPSPPRSCDSRDVSATRGQ